MKLTIERIGHHGDGIATGDAGPIYVPSSLPGEEVTGDLVKDTLTNVKILTPAPDRVKPPCPHARTCGGCLMQHASDPFVAAWKEGIVKG
ncbi:MAG: class I SAM-dependent RNA methyltransferase, partial [Pseudorhodobacter sp.]